MFSIDTTAHLFFHEEKKAPEIQTLEQDAPSKLQSTSASEEAVFMSPADISINDIGDEINPSDVKYSESAIGVNDDAFVDRVC